MLWSLDETALDLFARRPARGFRSGLRFVDDAAAPSDGWKPRQTVEIAGGGATPRLLVLLHAVAAFLLRSAQDASRSDGHFNLHQLQEATERVVFFDHELEADARMLLDVLCAKLRAHVADPAQCREVARRAIDRVALYNCRDTFQWLATLNQLHFELLEAPPAPLLIAINCVGSFHAIDKMTAKSVGDGLALSEQAFLFLKQFSHHHSPIVFAVKDTTASFRSGWESPELLPSSWSSQVSKRILLRTVRAAASGEAKDDAKEESDAHLSFEAKGCEVDVLDQQQSSAQLK
ncbi:hypothetical protein PybrP1_005409 [[Pythium] brassicae (nom. inval.)]|nr:hypothetical protein PybrP1_005409 [[Pythium] brassicae (nom. inval.)]